MKYLFSIFLCIGFAGLSFLPVEALTTPVKTVSGESTVTTPLLNKKPVATRSKVKLERAKLNKELIALDADLRIVGVQIDAAKVKISVANMLTSNYRKILERQLVNLQAKKKILEEKRIEIVNKIRVIDIWLKSN